MRISSKSLVLLCICAVPFLNAAAQTKTPAPTADTAKKTPPKVGIAEKTKSSKKVEGLLTVYQDTATGSVQLYIRKSQIGKEFLYQSFSISYLLCR